ncbi:MAG: hypothetical protein NT169_24985 [Chloroflexi bacterium]|nr:hypothetical protein [Chloroflexota bacterium]
MMKSRYAAWLPVLALTFEAALLLTRIDRLRDISPETAMVLCSGAALFLAVAIPVFVLLGRGGILSGILAVVAGLMLLLVPLNFIFDGLPDWLSFKLVYGSIHLFPCYVARPAVGWSMLPFALALAAWRGIRLGPRLLFVLAAVIFVVIHGLPGPSTLLSGSASLWPGFSMFTRFREPDGFLQIPTFGPTLGIVFAIILVAMGLAITADDGEKTRVLIALCCLALGEMVLMGQIVPWVIRHPVEWKWVFIAKGVWISLVGIVGLAMPIESDRLKWAVGFAIAGLAAFSAFGTEGLALVIVVPLLLAALGAAGVVVGVILQGAARAGIEDAERIRQGKPPKYLPPPPWF